MKYHVVLIGALLPPFGDMNGTPGPWGVYTRTLEESEKLGKEILERLSELEQRTAYIKITELTEVLVDEIHTAVERGPKGELMFVGKARV